MSSSEAAGLALLNQELLPLAKAFLGPSEVGIVLAVCLYGIMLVQVYNFAVAPGDENSTAIKALVAWVSVLETVHTALLCSYLFKTTVTNFGDAIFVGIPSKDYSAGVAMAGVMGASVQSFFAYRTYVVSRSLALAMPAWIGSAARVGLDFTLAVTTARSTTLLTLEHEHKNLVIATIIVSLVVDLINTGILSMFLAHRRSSMGRTSLVVDKLILWTLETGLVSCVCAVAIVALWFVDQFGWAFCLISIYGKLYSNSLLVSLNVRNVLRNTLSDGAARNGGGVSSARRATAYEVELTSSRPTGGPCDAEDTPHKAFEALGGRV